MFRLICCLVFVSLGFSKKKNRDEVSVQKNSFMQVFEKKMKIIDRILTKNSQKRNALQCKGMGKKNTYMY